MTAEVPATSAVRRVPFGRLSVFPKLFATYCTDYPSLQEFYAGDFRKPEARRTAAERAASRVQDRDLLADVLVEQNRRWAPEGKLSEATRAQIEALRSPETVAVVTGQQVGLFTGPLYTLYKTITVLQLAEQIVEETGRPAIPIFWLEGEDHDLEEVAEARLLRRNELVRVRWASETEKDGTGNLNSGSVGRLRLGGSIEEVLAGVDDTLPPSDFKPELMERVRAAYRPEETLLDAFARLLRALLPEAGLVFIDPGDRRLKEQAAPLFRREIEEPEAAPDRIRAASEKLEAAGYHTQVRARAGNLFLLEEGARLSLDFDGERFVLRDTEQTFSREELLSLFDEAPERFSPNVVLRPLMQDSLLPTAAYVAGPSEVSYFAQYKGVYDWAGISMPVIYPRASCTLVEGKVQKVLKKYDLSVPDLEGDLEQLFQRLVVASMDTDVDALFKEATRPMHEALNGLKPQVEGIDATLGASVESARAAIMKEMNDLKGRVVRAEKRNQDEVRAQLEKAHANLFPTGTLQERMLNVLYYLNKYSLEVPKRLRTTLALDTTSHQVIEL